MLENDVEHHYLLLANEPKYKLLMHHSAICCGVEFSQILVFIEPKLIRLDIYISIVRYGISHYYLLFDIFMHLNQMQYGRHSLGDGPDPAARRCRYIPRPG